ncbi:MAG TPA: hypothetical protein VLA62_00745 [Solirubrobacterales bacterium]|nr:hypothetical protein [Solirubrobacterales bacterium]
MAEGCSWCGRAVDPDDGFRLYEPIGERRAAFCRLEHVVPWAIRGPHWEAGEMTESPSVDEGPASCSQCGTKLGEVHVLLVRHRGEHRVADGFCGVDHLLEWAKAGGRWQ